MDPVDPDSDPDRQHWLQWAATRAAIGGQRSRMMTCPRRICCKALCFLFYFPSSFFFGLIGNLNLGDQLFMELI
jgi:hypothetical protein